MRAVLLTSGAPDARTGGSLYHRRIADRAPALGVELDIRPLERRSARELVARGTDVVVVDSIVAARIRPPVFDAPVVASVHQRPGGPEGAIAERMRRAALDLRAYRGADVVVVPSEHARRALRRSGVPSRRVHVVEPGCDPPPSRFARERGRSGVAFVCVANLSHHKRPLELLDAFAALSDLDVGLTMVGGPADAALASAVEARLRRPDLAGRAAWLGSVPPEEVPRHVVQADVLVSPALHESYGMAVAEALRAGRPAVVSSSGNHPNLVRDGVDGFVVPARDVGALAAAMRRLATDDATRARMSAAACETGGRLPTWDRTAERFVSVLRSAQRAGRSAA